MDSVSKASARKVLGFGVPLLAFKKGDYPDSEGLAYVALS